MVERYFGRDAYRKIHPIEEQDKPWVEALEAVDSGANKGPLLELLCGESPLSSSARWHLADLLDRYKLARRRGKPRTPSYDLPPALQKLERGKLYYQYFRHGRKNKDKAVELAAARCEANPETLRSFIDNKLSSARAVRKRMPPNKQIT
jgi:hypothetical protein